MALSLRGAAPPAGGFRRVCGACGWAHDGASWRRLVLVESVAAGRVQEFLTVPGGWAVEVRVCSCGGVLAARL